ncbi:hypothetical protein ACWEQL_28350 [Kitasatospora sp. NPDC004240]
MQLRDDTEEAVRACVTRQGRHCRPRPFGGRLRLPTLRFSGAAMAMSTVVGISIATTYLLNEQQGVGRRAGVARVGTTAPPGDTSPDRPRPVSDDRHDGPAGQPSASAGTTTPPRTPSPAPHGAKPATTPPATAPATAQATTPAPTGSGAATPVGTPSPTAPGPQEAEAGSGLPQAPPTEPGAEPAGQPHTGPRPLSTAPALPDPVIPDAPAAAGADQGASGPGDGIGTGTGPGGIDAGKGTGGADGYDDVSYEPGDPDDEWADPVLAGAATVQPIGRDGGTRHVLTLTVTESLTAFQAEFRLAAGDLAAGPGTTWTDLPESVVTVQQERGTLLYRFTVRPGADLPPGRYTLGVRGAVTAGVTAPAKTVTESWSASGFGIDRPRAVAALGAFERPGSEPAAPTRAVLVATTR